MALCKHIIHTIIIQKSRNCLLLLLSNLYNMEEQFDIRSYKPTGKERDFENALRPLQFEDFSGQDKVVCVFL